MKKSDYLKYVDPKDFEALYEEWAKEGKPQGNNPLYVKIWSITAEAVKACIGALQTRYHCRYQDYDEKVLDGTALMIAKLQKMDDTPKNIVNMCYLPVLGVCCGPKAIQKEFEDNMMSLDAQTDEGDSYVDIINPDDFNY